MWLTLGEHATPATVLQRVNEVVEHMGGLRANNLEEATLRYRDHLAERDCLIVIDDVWWPDLIEPLLLLSEDPDRPYKGVRAWLITTREPNVKRFLTERAAVVSVNEMTTAEATDVLAHYVPGDLLPWAETDAVRLRELAIQLGEWPLLLNIMGAALRKEIIDGASLTGALEYITGGLQTEGFEAFDQSSAATRTAQRNRNLNASVSLSLRRYTPEEQQRLFELSIFPDDTDVPVVVAYKLWGQTGKMERFAAQKLMRNFNGPFLRLDLGTRTFRFHDDQVKSFQVNIEGNYWHCYAGCGGGSLIDFWSEWRTHHGQDGSFTETVRELRTMLL